MVRDPRHRPYLREAQLPARERLASERHPCEPARDPYVLAAHPGRKPAPQRQPVRARLAAPRLPPLAPIELPDQEQPAACRRVDVRGQLADLLLQLLQRHRARVLSHLSAPPISLWLNRTYVRTTTGRIHAPNDS